MGDFQGQQQPWAPGYPQQHQNSQWAPNAPEGSWSDHQQGQQPYVTSQPPQTQWAPQQQQWQAAYPQQQPGQNWNAPAQAQQQAWTPTWTAPPIQLGDPMLNAGLQAGAHMVQQQAEMAAKRYMPGVTSTWGTLKTYFHVNNAFVLKKLSTMLFPFAKKEWSRSETREPPASDNNAPDLYIPLMALSTYVLTVGLAKGTSMNFDPEVIVDVFGSSLMVQLAQVGLMHVALWSVGPWAPQIPWFDLFAFSGYQYVGVALNMVVGLVFGHSFYLLSLVWTATCAAFVMFRTMQATVPPPEPGQRGKRRRVYFLVICALLQVGFMWFLGFTRELRSTGLFTFSSASGVSSASSAVVPDISADSGYAIPQSKIDVTQSPQFASDSAESSNSAGPGGGNRGARRKKRNVAGSDQADV